MYISSSCKCLELPTQWGLRSNLTTTPDFTFLLYMNKVISEFSVDFRISSCNCLKLAGKVVCCLFHLQIVGSVIFHFCDVI